jgi:hypothetical protein
MLVAAETKLAALLAALRALPPVDQLDATLRAAGFPADARSRTILINGFLRILDEYAQWNSNRRRPQLGKAFGEISKLLNSLLKSVFPDDIGRQAVCILDTDAQLLISLRDTVAYYSRIYGHRATTRKLSDAYDNLLYHTLYLMFAQIGESCPTNSVLLHRFTMSCT